jgi:hypothetical protein
MLGRGALSTTTRVKDDRLTALLPARRRLVRALPGGRVG